MDYRPYISGDQNVTVTFTKPAKGTVQNLKLNKTTNYTLALSGQSFVLTSASGVTSRYLYTKATGSRQIQVDNLIYVYTEWYNLTLDQGTTGLGFPNELYADPDEIIWN